MKEGKKKRREEEMNVEKNTKQHIGERKTKKMKEVGRKKHIKGLLSYLHKYTIFYIYLF